MELRLNFAAFATGLQINPAMVYSIDSGSTRAVIVASGFKVLQNELDIFESTIVDFAKDRPESDYGKVLCRS
jgi:hypothetical protein